MSDIIVIVLSTIGSVFILLASVGVVRMPDIYLRISVTTKAATLGVGLILAAAGVHFAEASVVSRVVAIICFLLLTAPIGAHMIGRTSYFTGIKLWKGSVLDELKGKYTHESVKSTEGIDQDNEKKGIPSS